MLYREIIAVCSQIHTKHINTLCGQNVGFVNTKSICSRSQWPRGLRRGSEAARLLGLRVRIQPERLGHLSLNKCYVL